MGDSQVFAALHVPERQREEEEGQEGEEGIEHRCFLSERGNGAEDAEKLISLRERPVRPAETVGGRVVVAALELQDQLRMRTGFERECRAPERLREGRDAGLGVVEHLGAEREKVRGGGRGRA
jgi:hypothetical protein